MKRSSHIAALVMACLLWGGWDWLNRPDEDVVRGNRAFAAEDYDEALRAYRAAHSRHGASPRIHYDIGTALYKLAERAGDDSARAALHTQAESAFRQATSSKEPVLRSLAHYNLGNTLVGQERYQDAVAAYKQALRANPRNDDARYNLELALRHLQAGQQDHTAPSQGQGQPGQGQPGQGQPGQGQPGQGQSDQSGQSGPGQSGQSQSGPDPSAPGQSGQSGDSQSEQNQSGQNQSGQSPPAQGRQPGAQEPGAAGDSAQQDSSSGSAGSQGSAPPPPGGQPGGSSTPPAAPARPGQDSPAPGSARAQPQADRDPAAGGKRSSQPDPAGASGDERDETPGDVDKKLDALERLSRDLRRDKLRRSATRSRRQSAKKDW